jgi:uncharacterized protein (UPF0248 family)
LSESFLKRYQPVCRKGLKALRVILFMVYRVLGRLLWRGGLERAKVVILHRGAPGDRKTIPGSRITEVKKSYLVCRDETGVSSALYGRGTDRQVTIPLHRVLEVRLDGRQIWKRAGKA